MDLLKDRVKSLNLYEVKAYVRKAQNVVMNYTEMEGKVREATNNEPWGASSTLMQQIAGGTYNYREREEICGMIFRRFTEKAANEWRQIYKALQLLEYLIKNGSERIVDDARANLSLISMLRSFHYIDSNGKDQGVNVRNRAKSLIALLNDEASIRNERKKARENAKKFGGVASSAFGGASSITPGAGYEEDYGENRVYGDGGVYGERYEEQRAAGEQQFEEYDVDTEATSSAQPTTQTSAVHANGGSQPDLFSFDGPSTSTSAPVANGDDDDDEFDDFQSAAPAAVPHQPQQTLSSNLAGLYNTAPQTQQYQSHQRQQSSDFGDFTSFTQAPAAPVQNAFFQPTQSFNQPTQTYNTNQPMAGATPSYSLNSGINQTPVSSKPAKNDAFSSLFSTAKTKVNSQPTSRVSSTIQSSIPTPKPQSTPQVASNNDDLFGDFTTNASSGNTSNNNNNNNGEIDLLSF